MRNILTQKQTKTRATHHSLGALRLSHSVGRQKEEKIIKDAINSSQSRVIHLVGEGGIGKSMLLEEVAAWCPHAACSNIIDLYMINTNSAVEKAIASKWAKRGFGNYQRARKQFEGRLELWDPARVSEEAKRVTEIFVQDFNRFARRTRVILCFDTVETIQFERAPIEEAYKIYPPGMELKTWLLKVIPRLRNTVTILAGRPYDELTSSLEASFKKKLKKVPLGCLDEQGTLEYLAAMEDEARQRPDMQNVTECLRRLSKEHRQVIHIYTCGNPIRLALLIDWLAHLRDMPDEFKTDLKQAQSQTEEQVEAIRERVRQDLILRLWENLNNPVPLALLYLVLARKGMDEPLFKRIYGREWSQIAQRNALEQSLRRLSFVKIRPLGTRRIFLHDEMYKIFEKPKAMSAETQGNAYDEIIQYYTDQIEREKALSRRNDLRVEQLYYELARDPRAGLGKFLEWDEEAIREQWMGYDMRLRDEVSRLRRKGTKWLKSRNIDPQWLDRDAALRWIRRFYTEKNYQAALSFIAGLRSAKEKLFAGCEYFLDLYEGIVKGQASTDLAATVEMLQRNLALLQPNGDELQNWQIDLARAEGYNVLGYTRTQLKQYQGAIQAFTQAVEYQRKLGLRAIEADTLNNQAYVYALQRNPDWALTLCEDARKIREDVLKHKSATALSHNTLGLIHIFAMEPERAVKSCEKALRLAQQAKSDRVEAMANNALGMAYRHRANKTAPANAKKAIQDFARAEKILKTAIEGWASRRRAGNPEIPFEVEAYNELGCTYRDWGIVLKRQKKDPAAKRYFGLALQYLRASIKRVPPELIAEHADGLEDMAEVYARLGRREQAFKLLAEAEALIPPVYQIPAPDFSPIEDPVNGYWVMLGKVNEERGNLFFNDGDLKEAMRCFVLGDAYYHKYSAYGGLVDLLTRRVLEKIEKLEHAQRTQVLAFARKAAKDLGLADSRLLNALMAVSGGG